MIDFNASIVATIRQAVYDHLTTHAVGVLPGTVEKRIEAIEKRIEAVGVRLDGSNDAIARLSREIACDLSAKMDDAANRLLQSVDFTSVVSRCVDARLDSRVEEVIDRLAARTSVVIDDKIAEALEPTSMTTALAAVLDDGFDLATYINWNEVSRSEIDADALAERLDIEELVKERINDLDFRLSVR